MVEFLSLRALKGVAKLSGSFAVSGLAAGCVAYSRDHKALAYTEPIYVPYWDLRYPVRRTSGKVVQFLSDGSPDVKYPVKDLLKSPWETFLPEPVAWAFFKSFCIYSALYLQGWIHRYNEAEDQAREEALLQGHPDDEELEFDMPEVDLEDVRRILNCSVRGGIRDVSTTCIRRMLEWRFSAKLNERLSWKLLKDFSPSARRKLQKHNPFRAMLLTARTTMRSSVLMQVADYIFSTTMDAYRLLVVPFLPVSWQRRLGLRQWGFPPAQPPPPLAEHAAPQDAALPADNIPAPAPNGLAPAENGPAPAEDEPAAIVEPAPEDEGSPAEWSWRFGLLTKKAFGNAARCCVSLGATSLGAGLTAAILPGNILGLACNGADMLVAIFVTNPDLNDWYESGVVPWRTLILASISVGLTASVLLQGSNERQKIA